MDVLDIAIQELRDAAERLRAMCRKARDEAKPAPCVAEVVELAGVTAPKPEDVRARLLAAGATNVDSVGFESTGIFAHISPSGKIDLHFNGLTLSCAKAALQVATGKMTAIEKQQADRLYLSGQQLAAAREEVKRLADKLEAQKRLNSKEFATIKRQQEENDAKDVEIARMKGEIAEGVKVLRKFYPATYESKSILAWLIRNGGA